MSQLSNQMQAKMTECLSELRGRVIGKMTGAGERIKSRPALKGDDSLKIVSSHDVMKQNDDGALLMGAMTGIPGLDSVMQAAADVAIEMYGERKAVHERPQDSLSYSPKAEAKILEQNRQDLALFQAMAEKLNSLDTAISSGHVVGLPLPGSNEIATFTEEEAIKNGLSVPTMTPDAEKRKLQPNEAFIAQFAGQQASATIGMHLN